MARKGHSQDERAKAVEAYARGEQVETLMKRHHVSRAAIYQWIAKAKSEASHLAKNEGKTPDQLSRDKLTDQSVRIMQLEAEVEKLQKALLKRLIAAGEI